MAKDKIDTDVPTTVKFSMDLNEIGDGLSLQWKCNYEPYGHTHANIKMIRLHPVFKNIFQDQLGNHVEEWNGREISSPQDMIDFWMSVGNALTDIAILVDAEIRQQPDNAAVG